MQTGRYQRINQLLIIFILSEIIVSSMGDVLHNCAVIPKHRSQCGSWNATQEECTSLSCCYQKLFLKDIPVCYYTSTEYNQKLNKTMQKLRKDSLKQINHLNLFKASSLLTIINMFIPNHKAPNTKVLDQNRNTACGNNATSNQCGDLNITELECTKKECCWLSSTLNSVRCYKPLNSIDVSNTLENKNDSKEKNLDSEKLVDAIDEIGEENQVFSSYTASTTPENFMSSTPDFALTLEPISFAELSTTFLNGILTSPKLSNDVLDHDQATTMRDNSSTPEPASSVDIGNMPDDKKTTTLYSQEYSTLSATYPATKTTSSSTSATSLNNWHVLNWQTTEVLPPFRDPLSLVSNETKSNEQTIKAQNLINDTIAITTHEGSKDLSEMYQNLQNALTLVRLIKGVWRRNSVKQHEKSENKISCSAIASTQCCAADPNGPCCQFSTKPQTSESHPRPRIVGGFPVKHLTSVINKQLHTSVAYITRKGQKSQFCGGTLINRRWVVTAAHCVEDYCKKIKSLKEIEVKLGKLKKSNFVDNVGMQTHKVDQVICHPNSCKTTNQPRLNDIALIRLASSIERTRFVSYAALPFPGEKPLQERKCIVMGWGKTRGSGYEDELKQVHVSQYSNEQCNKLDWRGCVVRECMMCAGDLNHDACEGDSGGPLFCQRRNGMYLLHGIYSWGRCGAEERKPAIYIRFSYYAKWIRKVMSYYARTSLR